MNIKKEAKHMTSKVSFITCRDVIFFSSQGWKLNRDSLRLTDRCYSWLGPEGDLLTFTLRASDFPHILFLSRNKNFPGNQDISNMLQKCWVIYCIFCRWTAQKLLKWSMRLCSHVKQTCEDLRLCSASFQNHWVYLYTKSKREYDNLYAVYNIKSTETYHSAS